MRRRLLRLGANKHDLSIKSGLGFTEMQGSTAECVELGGSHNPAPDQIYFEVLDEQSHSPLPDGKPGLFTITHLDRRGTVLLRYAIGDLTAISHEVCPHCGRQGPRIVTNTVRTFELVMFNGALINPDGIKEAIATVEGIEEYQIVFTKEQESDPSSPDALLVRVTAQPGEQERVQNRTGSKSDRGGFDAPLHRVCGQQERDFRPASDIQIDQGGRSASKGGGVKPFMKNHS